MEYREEIYAVVEKFFQKLKILMTMLVLKIKKLLVLQ